ncbi:energy transducer TonB [Tenacibaculum holothuriorum]|uniref:energy transducer TonB n=1 Tax=Tenacibaculum holothuriorum TaxID=1635173 RepID=UPI000A321BA7|nr:energy transducer TonB [Tenacibaculum holothuriorum]
MKTTFPLILAILLSCGIFSQEKCDTPDNSVVDPNSITKCSIEDVKKTLEAIDKKDLTIKYRKKRNRANATSLNGTSNIDPTIKEKSQLVSKIELKNDAIAAVKKIPFHVVEQIPLFDKCENEPLLQQSKCFEKQMAKHIISNFNYPREALNKKIEGRILVQFVINENGEVVNIKKKGPKGTELLEKEAVRLISKLPKFIAGKHNGIPVKVKYGLPIMFRLPKKS